MCSGADKKQIKECPESWECDIFAATHGGKMISNSPTPLLLLAVALLSNDVLGQPLPTPSSSSVIEEIVVTALHRQQQSQQVPISLDVIEGDALNDGLLRNLPDLAGSLPNVEMFADYGGQGLPVWVIRGVGLQDFNANNTPTAAVYVDEAYQTSSAQGASGLFDTERVEVLKGPQGGLYGRNTTGGVVRQLTRRASLDGNDGYVSAQAGSWQEGGLEFSSNHVLAESVAVRFAGRGVNSSDAWQRSLADGSRHGRKDLWDLRSWWLWQLSEGTRLDLKLYGGANDSELPLARSIGVYDASGEFCAAALEGRRDDSSCLSYAGMLAAQSGADTESLSPSRQRRNGATSLSNTINRLHNRQAGATGIVSHDSEFAGGSVIEFIFHYETFDYGFAFDYDGSPLELGHQVTASDITEQSQELRVASAGTGRLNWQMGAISSREEFVEDRQYRLKDNVLMGLVHGQLDYTQVTHSQSAWGHLELALNDQLTATGSLRYTRASKRYSDGSVTAPALPPPFDIVVSDLNDTWKLEGNWSGSLGLNWNPDDHLMLYASMSQAHKAGGFFGGFIFSPLEFAPYDEETVLAYEAGVKSDSRDGRMRLNASLFYYDYADVQGFANVPVDAVPGLVLERLGTLGDATHSGAEGSLTWAMRPNWELTMSAGYLDARINRAAGTTLNAMGEVVSTRGKRAYAPHWNGSIALSHSKPLAAGATLQSTLAADYRSDLSARFTSPVDKAVGNLPGYALINGSVTLTSANTAWMLSIWGHNLADREYSPRKAYDSLGSYIEIMGQPRSFGFQLRLHW